MSEEIEKNMDENPASQRHWLYGFNAAVLVVVSLVVLIFLAAICESDRLRNVTKFDLSTGGLNSLSGGSRKMLAKIGAKPEKYAIWSLFTDASDQVKRDDAAEAAKQAGQRRQINDLLQLYKRTASNITVEDRGDAARDDIERQIRDKYQPDFKPYQEALDAFDPLAKKLSSFLKEEAAAIGAFAQKPGTPQEEVRIAGELQSQFSSAPAQLERMQRENHREMDSNLPDWGSLKNDIGDTVSQIEPMFALLSDPAKLKEAKLPATLTAYFTSASDKYKAMEKELAGYRKQLDDLKPLKVQDVLSSLSRNTVVIMGADSAKVIPYMDLFTQSSAGGRSGDSGVTFNGEQAISSALYAMANPDKVKVVFVTATPQRLLEDMFSNMKQVLQDANFEVLEWSPSASASPGGPPESGGPPPASGKGVVWLVFPPETPSMQMMMSGMGAPNPQPVIDATKAHMAKGGQVLFMAESGGGMFGPTTYPYADLVKDFGIEVQSKYTIMHEQVATDPDTHQAVRQNSPFVGLEPEEPLVLAKHEITTPMEGLQTILGPMLTNQGPVGSSTVVKVMAPVPSGVEAMELVKTPYRQDFWASTDSSQTAKFDKDKDLAAPVPLMAVAVKDKGKKGPEGSSEEQRIAVLGAKYAGSNFFLDLNVAVVSGGMRYLIPRFPGNAELMKNTVLWLAGYENMIAVSARADASARLGSVSPTQKLLVELVVWLLAPGAALVLLVIVWAVRHRQ